MDGPLNCGYLIPTVTPFTPSPLIRTTRNPVVAAVILLIEQLARSRVSQYQSGEAHSSFLPIPNGILHRLHPRSRLIHTHVPGGRDLPVVNNNLAGSCLVDTVPRD